MKPRENLPIFFLFLQPKPWVVESKNQRKIWGFGVKARGFNSGDLWKLETEKFSVKNPLDEVSVFTAKNRRVWPKFSVLDQALA